MFKYCCKHVLLEVTLDDDFSLTKKKKKKKAFDLNDISAALPVYLMFLLVSMLSVIICLLSSGVSSVCFVNVHINHELLVFSIITTPLYGREGC